MISNEAQAQTQARRLKLRLDSGSENIGLVPTLMSTAATFASFFLKNGLEFYFLFFQETERNFFVLISLKTILLVLMAERWYVSHQDLSSNRAKSTEFYLAQLLNQEIIINISYIEKRSLFTRG